MTGPHGAVPVPPPLQPCPNCGLADHVLSVPAIYRSGRTTETVRSRSHDHRSETRVAVSDLARALAPAPDRQPGRVPIVLGVFALLGALAAFLLATGEDQFEAHRVRLSGETVSDDSSSNVATGLDGQRGSGRRSGAAATRGRRGAPTRPGQMTKRLLTLDSLPC
ncbi:hypothetical protein ACWC9T_25695 [Kitasatospora sp. NPDC001159]